MTATEYSQQALDLLASIESFVRRSVESDPDRAIELLDRAENEASRLLCAIDNARWRWAAEAGEEKT